MSELEMYVKTSAIGNRGIHWRKIKSQDEQPEATPELLQTRITDTIAISGLLDYQQPSLLLYRYRDKTSSKLVLQITGIESPKRSKEMGRIVFNSIVWIGNAQDENDQLFRKIAYKLLTHILEQDSWIPDLVSNTIQFHQLNEFRVKLDLVKQLLEELNIEGFSSDLLDQTKYQVETRSSDNLSKLAQDLLKYQLPKTWESYPRNKKNQEVDLLVVVTDLLPTKDILYIADAWRGFATGVEEPEDVTKKEEAGKVQLPQKRKSPKNQKYLVLKIILIVSLVILVGGVIIWVTM